MLVVLLLTSTTLQSCLTAQLPRRKEGCKIRTYVNAGLLDYLSARYDAAQMPRMAIFPFSVPETFARVGHESVDFGRQLATLFHQELLASEEISIVELFNRDSWPGKRAEFNTGNHTAIQLARNAGYDLLLVGYMAEITDEKEVTVYTKVIDTSNAATVWYGRTTSYSTERVWRRQLSSLPFSPIEDRPDLFGFPEHAERLAECTVERLIEGEPDHGPRSVIEGAQPRVSRPVVRSQSGEEQRPVLRAPAARPPR